MDPFTVFWIFSDKTKLWFYDVRLSLPNAAVLRLPTFLQTLELVYFDYHWNLLNRERNC